jgi:hypothetical protein
MRALQAGFHDGSGGQERLELIAMTKEQAADILNRYPGVIAFDPASGSHPPEAFLEGWFCPQAVLAMAWWMEHYPAESWWIEPAEKPSARAQSEGIFRLCEHA